MGFVHHDTLAICRRLPCLSTPAYFSPGASWVGGSLQGQSLVATGCDRSGLLRWLPLELTHACGGKLLGAFRGVKTDKGRGWQLDAPERASPGVALTESHGSWEQLLLSHAQRNNGTLLVKAVAMAQFSNASTARAAISCKGLKLVSAAE
mgnify:FL=1